MALTRKFLKALGIEDEKIKIIEEKNGEENAYLKKMIEKIDHRLNDAPEDGKSMMERYSAIRQAVSNRFFS